MRAARRPLAVAALLGAGFTAGVLRAIDEVALQAGGFQAGVAFVVFALALGTLLGCSGIQWRLRRRSGLNASDAGQHSGALQTAALALGLMAASGLNLIAIGVSETWRTTVVNAAVLPGTLSIALAVLPVVCAVALTAALSVVSILTLLEWREELQSAACPTAPVWLTLVAAFGGAVVALLGIGSLRLAGFISLAAPLAATLLAALTQTGAGSPMRRSSVQPPRGNALTVGTTAAIGAAGCAAALAMTSAFAGDGGSAIAAGMLVWGAPYGGVVLGRRVLAPLRSTGDGAAVALAVVALTGAVLATVLADRASTGAAVVVASIVAGVGAAALAGATASGTGGALPALTDIASRGQHLAIGALLVAVVGIAAPPRLPARPHESPAGLAILASGLNLASTSVTSLAVACQSGSAWGIDLPGKTYDVVRVLPTAGEAGDIPDRHRRRALRRVDQALLPTGRLLFEPSAVHLAELAGALLRRPVWRVTLTAGHGERFAVLAVGYDVPHWVALRCGGTAWTGEVESIR